MANRNKQTQSMYFRNGLLKLKQRKYPEVQRVTSWESNLQLLFDYEDTSWYIFDTFNVNTKRIRQRYWFRFHKPKRYTARTRNWMKGCGFTFWYLPNRPGYLSDTYDFCQMAESWFSLQGLKLKHYKNIRI